MPSNATPESIAAALAAAETYNPADTRVTVSPGLAGWLLRHRVSLAFTSYQTGQLILAGVDPAGRISFSEQNYARATGLTFENGSLHVASMFQLWRLENMLKPGEFANNAHDNVLVPRAARTVNYVDAHELGVSGDDVIFVNTRYSCLATADPKFSFRPVWSPRFITALAPEDRCHLNGLAMHGGQPAFVTAVATSDVREGWRDRRSDGGVVIDVASGEVVATGLSMPHSPRVYDGALWVLDSGTGRVVKVDQASGALTEVAFLSGFARGLTFHAGHAIVTVSKARDERFAGLPLGEALDRRGVSATCGILIVDLASGTVVESVLYDGRISEMFAVTVLPDVRNPMSLGPATVEMIGTVSFDPAALAK